MDAEGSRDELSSAIDRAGTNDVDAGGPVGALREADRVDAIAALERKLGTVVVLSILFVFAVIWALFETTSPGPAIALVVVSWLAVKRAVLEYRSLEERKRELLEEGSDTT